MGRRINVLCHLLYNVLFGWLVLLKRHCNVRWHQYVGVVRLEQTVVRSRSVSTRPVLKHGPRSLTCTQVARSCLGLRGVMKVTGYDTRKRVAVAAHRFSLIQMGIWWSRSVYVGTRKMVNYAWARRSQRKLWWRSVAILTCKSIVRPGYRGERLIEPSSSWFPPKFPSG